MKVIVTFVLLIVLSGLSFMLGTMRGEVIVEAPPQEWSADRPVAIAWQKFLIALESGAVRVFDTTDNEREQIDGMRYLAQLASAALEMKLAKGDPAAPQFTNWMSDYRKFLGDSPDAVYLTAEISSKYQYLISGNRQDASYLGFALYGKSINGWNRAAGNISTQELETDGNGDFTLLLSRIRPNDYHGNWLRLDDDTHLVMVREYFHDRATANEAEVAISLVGQEAYKLESSGQIAARIDRATKFFLETVNGNIALMSMLQRKPNNFDVPKEYNADFGGVFYPTQDNIYYGTWFDIADDEVLVVKGKAPKVDYWSISLQNRWLQSLDYKHFPGITLNNRSIEIDDDGDYTVYISSKPIAGVNWLDTAGYKEGLLSVRYQLAETADRPRSELVKWADLSVGD